MKNFKQLLFWQKSHLVTLKIYSITKASFPKEEVYGLVSQMRRSNSSVPTNIAAGCGRTSNAELKRFLTIATGSCSELEYQLLLSKDLSYISGEDYLKLSDDVIEIKKMIYSYMSTL
ncbi:four helix bundle protein [Pedobacter sp. UYEF25]